MDEGRESDEGEPIESNGGGKAEGVRSCRLGISIEEVLEVIDCALLPLLGYRGPSRYGGSLWFEGPPYPWSGIRVGSAIF